MNFLDLARRRYSTRAYTNQAVAKDKLDIILEAGQVAPTGHNNQPQRIIVVQSEDGLAKVQKAAEIYNAQLALIVCTDKDEVWTRSFDDKKITDIDASIVTDHMMLAATDIGLDSLWICRFKADVIKAEFALPDNIEVVNILAIGHRDETKWQAKSATRHEQERKVLAKTVFYEDFQ
jgi:Nitroreductase